MKVSQAIALAVPLIVATGISADSAYAFRLTGHSVYRTNMGGTFRPDRMSRTHHVPPHRHYPCLLSQVSDGHCCPEGDVWISQAGRCLRKPNPGRL